MSRCVQYNNFFLKYSLLKSKFCKKVFLCNLYTIYRIKHITSHIKNKQRLYMITQHAFETDGDPAGISIDFHFCFNLFNS